MHTKAILLTLVNR